MDTTLPTSQPLVLLAQKTNSTWGCAEESITSWLKMMLHSLFSSDEIMVRVLSLVLGSTVQESAWMYWSKSTEGPQTRCCEQSICHTNII